MASRWLLDTSALLALRDDEPGADRVPASDGLLEQTAAFKASHSLSVVHTWIAAAARQEGALLMHKDPEFTPLVQLPQEWLG
jgi:predicted nucleic acid-binding protein